MPGTSKKLAVISQIEPTESLILKRLKLKVSSYNNQDKKAGRLSYNDTYECWTSPLLTLEQIQELIKTDGLLCWYCNNETTIIPNGRKDSNQMTLERIDNNKTHRISNVKIACWGCNELRGNSYDSKHFGEIKKRK